MGGKKDQRAERAAAAQMARELDQTTNDDKLARMADKLTMKPIIDNGKEELFEKKLSKEEKKAQMEEKKAALAAKKAAKKAAEAAADEGAGGGDDDEGAEPADEAGGEEADSASASKGAAKAAAKASFTLQFVTLLKRAWRDVARNPMRGKAPVMQALFSALIVTVIWARLTNDQNGVQDRAGVLFFLAANGLMQNVMGVLTTFANERAAVLREQENGMYHTLPYFCARISVDLPLKMLCPGLLASISYYAVGLQPDGERFLNCLVTVVLLALSGNAIGLFLACLFSDVALSLMVAPMVILPLMMFSGFFINPESTPIWLMWIEFISPMKYAFSALAQNEFSNLTLHCTEKQMRIVGMSQLGVPIRICPIPTGEVYLDGLNVQPFLTVPNCQWLLIVEVIGFTLLAYVGLEYTSHRARARTTVHATVVAETTRA